MDFTWDPNKRTSNLQKHGVDFVDAARILTRPHLAYEVTRPEHGEERFAAIGLLLPPDIRPEAWSGPLAVVIYTMREGTYRIISARRATSHERKRYNMRFGGGPGPP